MILSLKKIAAFWGGYRRITPVTIAGMYRATFFVLSSRT